jgi:hypothetical protein
MSQRPGFAPTANVGTRNDPPLRKQTRRGNVDLVARLMPRKLFVNADSLSLKTDASPAEAGPARTFAPAGIAERTHTWLPCSEVPPRA